MTSIKALIDDSVDELKDEFKGLEYFTQCDKKQTRSKFTMCAKCNQYMRTKYEPENQHQLFIQNLSSNTTSHLSSGCSNNDDVKNDPNISTTITTTKSSLKEIRAQNKIYTWVGFTSCFLGMLYLFFRNNAMQ